MAQHSKTGLLGRAFFIMSDIILLVSVQASGTRFVMEMLEEHKDISWRCNLGYYTRVGVFHSAGILHNWEQAEFLTAEELERELLKYKMPVFKYLLLFQHIDNLKMHCVLQKLGRCITVVPLRHPFSVVKSRSLQWRLSKKGDVDTAIDEEDILKRYDEVLSLHQRQSTVFVPVDLLGMLEQPERIKEMEAFFGMFSLGLPEERHRIATWVIGHAGNYDHSLSDAELFPNGQLERIHEYVDKSGLLPKLKMLGIPYGDSPNIPIGHFTYDKISAMQRQEEIAARLKMLGYL
jgi:hypothetical protein